MKKILKRVLGAAMALVMVLALTACGEGGGSATKEVGTYKFTRLSLAPFDAAVLINSVYNSLTLYSDNTFVLCNIADTNATSDFESVHRSAIIEAVAYGTYEVVETNEELQEKTIKITSVTRVINGNTDTDTDEVADDVRDWVLTNNGAIGTEIIVNDDSRSMTEVSILNFRLGTNQDPQQEAMAQSFWAVQ